MVATLEIKKLGNTENEGEGPTATCLILHDSDVEGQAARTRVTRRKSNRRGRRDVLFQVVGMYEKSASVAKIMMVATAALSDVADHVKADE
jgi:hypothetical protein